MSKTEALVDIIALLAEADGKAQSVGISPYSRLRARIQDAWEVAVEDIREHAKDLVKTDATAISAALVYESTPENLRASLTEATREMLEATPTALVKPS